MTLCNKNNTFLLYPSSVNSNKNILFLGSCRMSPLMYYWHVLYPDYNIYNIYIPYWIDRSLLDKPKLQSILDNSHLLITETVRNYEILNTDKNIQNNFFDNFKFSGDEIRISSLELHMYYHDLHNTYKIIENKDKLEAFEKSKNRLKNSLISKQQKFIWNFIESNLQDIRLFATHNHPNAVLSIGSFLYLAQRLNIHLKESFYSQIIDKTFLQGHHTPILDIDIKTYGFRFPCAIFPYETINDAQFKYLAPKNETSLSLTSIEKLLSYTT